MSLSGESRPSFFPSNGAFSKDESSSYFAPIFSAQGSLLRQVRCRAMQFHLMAEFGRRHELFPGQPFSVGACERLSLCFAEKLSGLIP